MSYFDEVYLKRMNKNGNTMQERIKTAKENEFDKIYLKRSPYQSLIYEVNETPQEIVCVVAPTRWKDKLLSNLHCSMKSPVFKTGDVLKILQKVKNEEFDRYWIVISVSDDITHGYRGYEVMVLDTFINQTDEYGDTIRTIPIRFVNETSTFVQDKFTSYGAVSYREPLAHRKFIAQDNDFLKKNMYFDYKDRGWEIVGKDNLSIDGVAYVSIAEYLTKPPEPKTTADIEIGEDENFFLNALNKG